MLSMSKEHHHTVNYGGGSIGIFACVSAKYTGQLHLIKDGWYHVQKKTWKRTSPPSEHWWWVMDGSGSMPMTQNIQQGKQRGSTLKLSQSPDLSPTKYLLRFEVKPSESFSKDEWAKIPPEMWWPTTRNVLVLSLPTRTSPPSTRVMANSRPTGPVSCRF